MNSLFLPFLVLIVFAFHIKLRTQIRQGKVKESFCAIWCIDTIFAISGTIISFILYDYKLLPFLTWRNILLTLMYLILTVLFLLISPSGLSIFRSTKERTSKDILMAEYRFNDTLCMVQGFFMTLLFTMPILITILLRVKPTFFVLSKWDEQDICGAVCFIAFLFLVPLSLRQMLFWLRNLCDITLGEDDAILKKYGTHVHFHTRNHKL